MRTESTFLCEKNIETTCGKIWSGIMHILNISVKTRTTPKKLCINCIGYKKLEPNDGMYKYYSEQCLVQGKEKIRYITGESYHDFKTCAANEDGECIYYIAKNVFKKEL